MIVCGNCGHKNEATDAFCGNCGQFLEWVGKPAGSDDDTAPAPKATDVPRRRAHGTDRERLVRVRPDPRDRAGAGA